LLTHLTPFPFDDQFPGSGDEGFRFIWHGGEPFMVPIEHYDEIGKLQKSIIGPLMYQNLIQTNLTILTDRHIEWLKNGRFLAQMGVGFSFDVYGDQRRHLNGKDTSQRILNNLQLLLDNNLRVGGITVLSRSTISHLENIFHFYDALGLDFRLLPYHLETSPEQTATNAVTPEEISETMCNLFDLWSQSEHPVTIAPLNEYTEDAIAFINKRMKFYYDKDLDENIFIIDTDGRVFGHETYLHEHAYGNLFEQPFEEILDCKNRHQLVAKATRRMETYCVNCEFFGACSGYPVAEANPMEEEWLSRSGCYVAPVLAHIVDRLTRSGLGLLPETMSTTAGSQDRVRL
jgi:uncharacterized protein